MINKTILLSILYMCFFIDSNAQVGVNIASPVGTNVFHAHEGSPTSGTYTNDVVISSDGYMGIHTTNPQAKLDLRGNLRVTELHNSVSPVPAAGKHFIAAQADGTFTTRIPGNIPTVQGVYPSVSQLAGLPKTSYPVLGDNTTPHIKYPINYQSINITLPVGRWVVYFNATHEVVSGTVAPPNNPPAATSAHIRWDMLNLATGSADNIEHSYSTSGFVRSYSSTMCVFLVDNQTGNSNNDSKTYYFRGTAISLYDMKFAETIALWAEYYSE